MPKIQAAIDIGSHTARLLVAQMPGERGSLRPLHRHRTYIRLAEGFDRSGSNRITPEASVRLIHALKKFQTEIESFGPCEIHAVATGVVREASNQEDFLADIHRHTGILVRTVSGEEEAILTARGVLNDFRELSECYLIFDLGGGSTEFYIQNREKRTIQSIPLGAAVLTHQFILSDPPEPTQLDGLSQYVDNCLKQYFPRTCSDLSNVAIIGTGGTITSLALMIKQVPVDDQSIETVRGASLSKKKIEKIFTTITNINLEGRLKLPGMDPGRAKIIPAGCLVVIKILQHAKAHQMRVSLSDLLEGILLKEEYYDS